LVSTECRECPKWRSSLLREIFDYLNDKTDLFLNASPSTTTGHFRDHEIAVSSDLYRIFLYIDNQEVEESRVYPWPKKDAVLLRGVIRKGTKNHLVHIYGKGSFLRTRIKICVDGKAHCWRRFLKSIDLRSGAPEASSLEVLAISYWQ